jgi:hypothetical protein
MDYAVKPNGTINLIKATGSYPISSGIGGYTSISKDMSGDRRLEFEDTVTFDLQRYRLSLTGRADTNDNYFAGLSFNIAFGKVPDHDKWLFSGQNLAETGTVVVRPYLDHNYNQQRDEGEEAPPNTTIKVGSQTIKTDSENDLAIAKNLGTDTPISIRLDQEKQENPFWTASSEEYRVVPRAGTAVVVDYPLFETSQIDGVVHLPSQNIVALKVELVNTEGQVVGFARTAFDGYFLLQGVMPGSYKIRVAEENLAQHSLKQKEEYPLIVKESDFYTKDIALIQ